MTTSSQHNFEHDALMTLMMQAGQKLASINNIILITLDDEGRPIVSSTLGDPAITSSALRQLGGAEEHITLVTERTLEGNN